MSSAHENRVHLCRLSPRRDALDVYFADDDIASEAEPLWELPPDYDTGDTLVIVVPAREPAILNIETLTSSSADGGCDTEDSAGAEIDGVSVPGIKRRMGEPMPAAPATLDPDYAARWMAAFDAERADPTPWYLRDTTGCAESARTGFGDRYLDIVSAGGSICVCCGTDLFDTPMRGETEHRLQQHLCNAEDATGMGHTANPGLALLVEVCASCHARLHDPFGPTVMEVMFRLRPPCPKCGRHQTIHMLWGMPPGPPPPGTIAAGCVIPVDDTGRWPPDLQCGHCGHEWSTTPEPASMTGTSTLLEMVRAAGVPAADAATRFDAAITRTDLDEMEASGNDVLDAVDAVPPTRANLHAHGEIQHYIALSFQRIEGPQPQHGHHVRAHLFNYDGRRSHVAVPDIPTPGELVVGTLIVEDVDSAWGRYTRFAVIDTDGATREVEPDSIVSLTSPKPRTPQDGRTHPMDAPMQIWMEITDRPWEDLGDNVSVRRYLDNGRPRRSGALAEQMLPGDIVLHWWRGEQPSALVGWSVVVGHPELIMENVIDLAGGDTGDASADDAVSEMVGPQVYDDYYAGVEVFVLLEWSAELDPAVTLPDIQEHADEIVALETHLKEKAEGSPINFPFQGDGRGGIRGACPHYLARFPAQLLKILPGLPTVEELTGTASAAVRRAQITRTVDPARQAAVDEHAAAAAAEYLVAQGYAVIDVSAFEPHTLRATKDDETAAVLVVGSADDVDEIDIAAVPTGSGLLLVVDQIDVHVADFPSYPWLVGSKGRLRLWEPWTLEESHRRPQRHVVNLPPARRERSIPGVVLNL